jgi:hypothetical protein
MSSQPSLHDQELEPAPEAFERYLDDVRTELKKAHRNSMRLLAGHRIVRGDGLVAAAIVPVLIAAGADKWVQLTVAAGGSVLVGASALTAMGRLSLLDRARRAPAHRTSHLRAGCWRLRCIGTPIGAFAVHNSVSARRNRWSGHWQADIATKVNRT